MGALKTHRGSHEETFAKCVAICSKCGVPKAASRTVKKGEDLLDVITFDNLVSAVAHVAAQGLPRICADPRIGEKRGPKRAAKTSGRYTKTNLPVAMALQELARGNMLHFMISTAFLLIANHQKKKTESERAPRVPEVMFGIPAPEQNAEPAGAKWHARRPVKTRRAPTITAWQGLRGVKWRDVAFFSVPYQK